MKTKKIKPSFDVDAEFKLVNLNQSQIYIYIKWKCFSPVIDIEERYKEQSSWGKSEDAFLCGVMLGHLRFTNMLSKFLV